MFNREPLLAIVKGAIQSSAHRDEHNDFWMHRIERRDFKAHTNIVLRHMGFREELNKDIIAQLKAAGYKAEAFEGSYYVGCGWNEVFTRIKCQVSQTA
ncbi:MAG: hypothetical protein ACKOPU_00705 [Candidatus Planktophila sp.]